MPVKSEPVNRVHSCGLHYPSECSPSAENVTNVTFVLCPQEYLAGGESSASTTTAALNMADFLGDSELEQLHSDRIAQLQEQAEKRTQLAQKGHGIYSEISEGESSNAHLY